MFVHAFLDVKTGNVIIPSLAQTEAGIWMDVEPVFVYPLEDKDSIVEAMTQVWNHPLLGVPQPGRFEYPKPVVLKYTNAKSYSAFAKRHKAWYLEQLKTGLFRLQIPHTFQDAVPTGKDSYSLQSFPMGTTLEKAIETLIASMNTEKAK